MIHRADTRRDGRATDVHDTYRIAPTDEDIGAVDQRRLSDGVNEGVG
jgi:hypothetical protein